VRATSTWPHLMVGPSRRSSADQSVRRSLGCPKLG
jgi:hypothetical protein